MRVFHCDHCHGIVYIENAKCLSCHSPLAFLPDQLDMSVIEACEKSESTVAVDAPDSQIRYRRCQNDVHYGICNWAVLKDDPNPLCISCRLTEVIPDLSLPGNKEAWGKMEYAKRRMLYNLMQLNLSFTGREEDPKFGLAFRFMGEPLPGKKPVSTGHMNGIITIHVAEADDAERERRRLLMQEPYRTLLGHFRHEVGHYYWNPLVWIPGRHDAFRKLFGDERADYGEALKKHYHQGPPTDWLDRHVSSYASCHPLEDWAETFAHYFHIFQTLDTANYTGVQLNPGREDEPHMDLSGPHNPLALEDFDALIENWMALTYLLNSLTRSLGQSDAYPFVLTPVAIEKLRFVHNCLPPRLAQTA